MSFFGIFGKPKQQTLDSGLEKTKESLLGKLTRAIAGKHTIDDDVLDSLEETLITSDVDERDRPFLRLTVHDAPLRFCRILLESMRRTGQI